MKIISKNIFLLMSNKNMYNENKLSIDNERKGVRWGYLKEIKKMN